jgi:hypothetical protein
MVMGHPYAHDEEYDWLKEHRPHLEDDETKWPRYDLDWQLTGPLVEKYQMQILIFEEEDFIVGGDGARPAIALGKCYAATNTVGHFAEEDRAKTILEAVCKRILRLHKQGELNA